MSLKGIETEQHDTPEFWVIGVVMSLKGIETGGNSMILFITGRVVMSLKGIETAITSSDAGIGRVLLCP